MLKIMSHSDDKPHNNINQDTLKVPDGLTDLLQNFVLAVLNEKPPHLNIFAREYFKKAHEVERAKQASMVVLVDDDDTCGEPEELRKVYQMKYQPSRRKSVLGESYNPENDSSREGNVTPIPYHPKSDKQMQKLKESIKNILLFRKLDDEQMSTVINAMAMKTVTAGDVIIRQGDDADFFYVIEHGLYNVYILNESNRQLKVNSLQGDGSFGELALMYSQPRSATVKAMTDGILWTLDRRSFQKIVIQETYKNRRLYEILLSKVPFLKPLSREERSSVVDGLFTRVYYDGDAIIKVGEEGDGIYFIEAGNCTVKLDKGDGEVEVKQLKKGQYFGELALLDNSKRTASVYAIGKVKCGFLGRDTFERLLGPCKDIMKRDAVYYDYASRPR